VVTALLVGRGRALEWGLCTSRLVVVKALAGGGEGRRRRVLAEYVREGAAAMMQGSKLFVTGLCTCVSDAAATVAASEAAILAVAAVPGELPAAGVGPLAGHGWPTSSVRGSSIGDPNNRRELLMPQFCKLRDSASGDTAGDDVSDWIPPMTLMLPPCGGGPLVCVIEPLVEQRGPGLRLWPPPPVLPMPLSATGPVEAAEQPLGAVADALLALTPLFANSRLAKEGLLERIRCCNFSKDRSNSPPSSLGGLTTGVTFECRPDAGTTAEPRVPICGVELQVVASVAAEVFKTADDKARANASPAAFASAEPPLLIFGYLGTQGVVGDQARWRGGCVGAAGDAEAG